MSRAGRWTALAALAAAALALGAYRAQDYRPRFAREAGELVAVHDSTGVALLPDGTTVTDVTLISDTGLRVRARVRSPGLLDGVHRPAAILLGGWKNGRAAVEVPDSDRGMILASIEYPYEGPRHLDLLGWMRNLLRIRHAIMETPPAILLLAQYLYVREDVDPERVTIIGASLGAPFAVTAAATDRRIAGVALVHGGGDINKLFAAAFRRELPGWALGPVSQGAALLLAPVEPTKYVAAIAPRPLLMLNASDDEKIPRACALELYRAAQRPKRLMWLPARHISLSDRQDIETMLDEILVWMRERGLR